VIDRQYEREALFDDAKRLEVLGLIRRGIFRLVIEEELPDSPNIVPSRFMLAIKHGDDGQEKLKARFVWGGHRDKDKSSIVHAATNLQQFSIPMMISLAACLGFAVWTTDVNQAYLQPGSALLRDIFVRPGIIELETVKLPQLLKPLYVLSDAGECWSQTLTAHHLDTLHMEQSVGDFALFMKRVGTELQAMSGTYVDDLLRIGTPEARVEMETYLRETFDVKESETLPVTFTGMKLSRTDNNGFQISLSEYFQRLSPLPQRSIFELYRSFRAKLAWVVNARPDITCALSMAASMTKDSFTSTATVVRGSASCSGKGLVRLLKCFTVARGILLTTV
jgi:Reverse transcriptase (RNA-dependent DNA polymerase)